MTSLQSKEEGKSFVSCLLRFNKCRTASRHRSIPGAVFQTLDLGALRKGDAPRIVAGEYDRLAARQVTPVVGAEDFASAGHATVPVGRKTGERTLGPQLGQYTQQQQQQQRQLGRHD